MTQDTAAARGLISEIRHPCYSEEAHSRVGRLHLPVAPRCNIRCRYCERLVGRYSHSFRPGVARRVIAPSGVADYIGRAVRRWPDIEVVAVAGPGEPLYNPESFEALRLARRHFPNMKLCVCTNGLLLPDRVGEMWELGVGFVTVTVNALRPEVSARICAHVLHRGRLLRGLEGARRLLENQLRGIEIASRAGMAVKVNSVLVPGVNDGEIPLVAMKVASLGARIINVMPLIPAGEGIYSSRIGAGLK